MEIKGKFLRSKLARRIFWLFVVCALLPVTVFAVISLRNVSSQLEEQSKRQLRQATHEAGMGIVERLSFLDAELKLIAADIRSNPDGDRSVMAMNLSSQLKGRFEGLSLIKSAGGEQLLFGKLDAKLHLNPGEKEHLRAGKSLLKTRPCDRQSPCIFLSRSLDSENSGEEILVGEIHGEYLWDAQNIPESMGLCFQDETGAELFCSSAAPAGIPVPRDNRTSGQLEWNEGGQEYLVDYWRLFLKPGYYTANWTVVASRTKPDILAPLSSFKRNFALVSLLALWVVALVSLVQIRRNLIPLGVLHEGTRRIAGGEYQSRVRLQSGDEFEELASSFNAMAGRIEKQINSLKTMNEIDRAILSAWEVEQIVDALMACLPTLVGYDAVSICLLDPQSPQHAVTYFSECGPEGSRTVSTLTFTGEELESLSAEKEIQAVTYVESCPYYLAPLASRGMTNFLVAPIVLKNRVCGVIGLGQAKGVAWTEADRQQMQQVADQMAVAISNARLVNELRQLNLGTLTALARAIDAKSPWTAGHAERVTQWALKLAEAFELPQAELDIIHRAGLLHDIGKIGVPGYVLDKPGKLTAGEMEQMREHVNIGARILEPILGFAECMPIICQHHEWVNGEGYPKGLVGDQICFQARIFAVADCYDALTTDRPYRPGMSAEQALKIITDGAGKQFDPVVVETFARLLKTEAGARQGSEKLVETT